MKSCWPRNKKPGWLREGDDWILALVRRVWQVWLFYIAGKRSAKPQESTAAYADWANVISRTNMLILAEQLRLHQFSIGRHVTLAKYHLRPAMRSFRCLYMSSVKSVGIAFFASNLTTSSRIRSPSSYRMTAETFQLCGLVQYRAQPFS